MRLAIVCLFGAQSAYSSLAGEYETTTRYTQRTTKQICPSFPSLENAQYTCQDDELTHGVACVATCNDGYTNEMPDGVDRTCSCFTARSIILLPKPCEWEGPEFPECQLEEGLEEPTCPTLPDFSNGSWECTSDTMSNGETCYSICNEGFRLEENNVKFSRFDCACTGTIQDPTCLWMQRNAILNIAERMFPRRIITPIMQRSLGAGPEKDWDMSLFRSGTAILPNCLEIETTVENDDGEIVATPQCPSVPDIPNGMLVCSSENYIGSICRLVCDDTFLGHGYGDKNRVKCVRNQKAAGTSDEYQFNKDLSTYECIDTSNAAELVSIELEECTDPRGENEADQAEYPGYYSCKTTLAGHFLIGEQCDLTCFAGFKYGNKKRTHKVCHCKRGKCFWKFDERTRCIPDEDVLKALGIFKEFSSFESNVDRIMFAESQLAGKDDKILDIRRQIEEQKDNEIAMKIQRSFQRSADKRERIANRIDHQEARKEDRLEMRTAAREAAKVQQTECIPLAFDPETSRPPRCTGSSPGSRCTFVCKKGFKIHGPSRTYCSCNKRGKCGWSHRSKCIE